MQTSIANLIAQSRTRLQNPFFISAAESLISTAVSALTNRGCVVNKSSVIAVCADPSLFALLAESPSPVRSSGEIKGVLRTIEILFAKTSDTESLAA